MNLTFETQLQVVQRALGEVVLPALSGAPGHVIEQLHLSMAAIGFLQQRMPHARRYYRATLTAYCEFAEAAAALVTGSEGAGGEDAARAAALAAAAAAGRALLQSPEADEAAYQQASGELRAGIAALVEGSAGTAHEAALDALVLERSEAILLQDRVWCLPLGFELRPQDLPAGDWAR
jgi:hypothetical protein